MKCRQMFLVAAMIFMLAYTPVFGASFDCSKAQTKLEKTICRDPRLNSADSRLGKAYSKKRKSLSKSARTVLKQEQRSWLKQRTSQCSPSDADCLLAIYEQRIDELEGKNNSQTSQNCYDNAVTQSDLNNCAGLEYEAADKELNKVYQIILKRYANEPKFIKNLKVSQRAWIKFRDAEMEAIFPYYKDDPHYYGSMFSMCWSIHMKRLTQKRTHQLNLWLDGLGSEEGCSGSHPVE